MRLAQQRRSRTEPSAAVPIADARVFLERKIAVIATLLVKLQWRLALAEVLQCVFSQALRDCGCGLGAKLPEGQTRHSEGRYSL